MPGELETEVVVENGTQEVVPPQVKQAEEVVPTQVKQEIVAAEVKPEVVPAQVKEEIVAAEVKKEVVVPVEVKQVPAEIKQVEAPIEPTIQQNGTPKNAKKNTMSTGIDSESVRAAYDDVRSDSTDTQWAVFKFDGSRIVPSATGADFEKFREQFGETERAFGYIRIQTGDEMSKRQKFLFVTWVGHSVSVLQRAKMSTDKSVVKGIISNFAKELQLENPSEIDLGHFVEELNKAGGANYGTGVREI